MNLRNNTNNVLDLSDLIERVKDKYKNIAALSGASLGAQQGSEQEKIADLEVIGEMPNQQEAPIVRPRRHR